MDSGPKRRRDFTFRRKRGLVDWLVLIFVLIAMAAAVAWIARAAIHRARRDEGLEFAPIWE